MQGKLIAPNQPCPKCKSFMYMPRKDGNVSYRLCKNCGYKGLNKQTLSMKAIKIYLERFKFWKS